MADRYPFRQTHPQHGMLSQPQHSNMVRFQGMPVWQHVPNPRIPFPEDQRQREYLKQQQKLRLMASTSNKAVSADKLIENLLDKKETFRPKSISVAPSNHQALPHSALPSTSMYVYQQTLSAEANKVIKTTEASDQFEQLPLWLKPKSPAVPPLYVQIWNLVQLESGLTDTTKVFQLLITSGLTSDILGFIWGLANKKVPGQLTQQELYVALALVALAQSGCTFNNLSVLNLIPQPPIPKLNIINPNGAVSNVATSVSQQGKMRREELNLQSHHGPMNNGMNLTHPMKNVKVVPEDDFTEFQSCSVSLDSSVKPISFSDGSEITNNVSSISHSSNLQKTSCQNESTSQLKFPSVMIVSNTNQARGIGSRLANHSLGTPKQNKVKHHKHHHHHHHHRSNLHSSAPISSSLDDDFTEFQQAKDSTNVDNTEVYLKYSKPSASNTYVLKESAIRCDQKQNKSSELESKCTNTKRESIENNSSVPPRLKINLKEPSLLLESKTVSAVKERNEISNSSKELMSVEEDKYSALRNLTFESISNNEDGRCDTTNSSDDFGDFLSAEPLGGNDSFIEISSRETSVRNQQPPDISAWNLPSPQLTEFQVDWAAFDSCLTNHEVNTTIHSEANGSDSPQNKNLGASDLEIMQLENLQIGNISQSNNAHTSSIRVVHSLNLQDILINDFQHTSSKNTANTDLFLSPGEKNVQYPIDDKDYLYDNDASTFVFKTINDDDDDDFGDFVGPDTVSEENCVSNNKDIVFDGQSMLGVKDALCDSQSVSSLELPPLTMSRHGSLPSLDLKVFSSGAEQSEAQRSWNFSPQVVERQLGDWLRCLNSCLNLLQAAQTTFTSIASELVLDEVLSVHEGKEYLYNLREVYGVSERIRQSFKQISTESKEIEKVFNEIDAVWSDLTVLLTKADISTQLQMPPMEMTENAVCGICLANLYGGGNTNPLEYSGNIYHASCANLWVNCVESSLPALHGSLL